jgi:hypothetical protein
MQVESVPVRMVEPSQQGESNLTQVLLVCTVLKDPTAILILEDSLKDKNIYGREESFAIFLYFFPLSTPIYSSGIHLSPWYPI